MTPAPTTQTITSRSREGDRGEGVRGNREVPPPDRRRGLVRETWFPPRERAEGERRSPPRRRRRPAPSSALGPAGEEGLPPATGELLRPEVPERVGEPVPEGTVVGEDLEVVEPLPARAVERAQNPWDVRHPFPRKQAVCEAPGRLAHVGDVHARDTRDVLGDVLVEPLLVPEMPDVEEDPDDVADAGLVDQLDRLRASAAWVWGPATTVPRARSGSRPPAGPVRQTTASGRKGARRCRLRQRVSIRSCGSRGPSIRGRGRSDGTSGTAFVEARPLASSTSRASASPPSGIFSSQMPSPSTPAPR